jgi:hypothetical protein
MSLLLERCLFPKRMTLPFIVQGAPSLQGDWYVVGGERERERERECFRAPSVGVVSFVSRDRQLCQSESWCGHRLSPESRSGHLVPSLYIVLFRSGDGCAPISMV